MDDQNLGHLINSRLDRKKIGNLAFKVKYMFKISMSKKLDTGFSYCHRLIFWTAQNKGGKGLNSDVLV